MVHFFNYLILIICNVLTNSVIIKAEKFKIFWNVPTFMCHKYGMKFEEVSSKYGIIQNINDSLNGDKMAILYHSGSFPAFEILDDNTTLLTNGIVPQKGDFQEHLTLFEQELETNITDPNFSGIAVLDYELWRPVFRQNFNKVNRVYRDYSIHLEKNEFRILLYNQARILASLAFNYTARMFFEETIKLSKSKRPHAAWGYYDYPKCYHLAPGISDTPCGEVHEENDNMKWLWDLTDIFLPSIYAAQNYKKGETLAGTTNRRLTESFRIANQYNPPKRVLPYLRYRYRDDWNRFLLQEDYLTVFRELDKYKIDGLVVWGSDKDVNTRQKCVNLMNHLHEVLGPAMKKKNLI